MLLKALNGLAAAANETAATNKQEARKSIKQQAKRWLRLACLAAIRNDHVTTVAALVKLPQIPVNAIMTAKGVQFSLASYAARFAGPEVVRLVLRPNTLNYWFNRPLSKALWHRNYAAAYALLDARADVGYGMIDGDVHGGPFLSFTNARTSARTSARLDRLVQKLVAAKVTLHENDIRNHVTKQGRADVVRVLHRAKACVDGSLLFHACRQAVRSHVCQNSGRSATTAIQQRLSLTMSQRLSTVRAVLRCKVDVDAPDIPVFEQKTRDANVQDADAAPRRTTALHMAVENGASSLVAVLLAFKASVGIPNENGEMPIETALRHCVQHSLVMHSPVIDSPPRMDLTLVHQLLDAKADPTTESTYAVMHQLLDATADPTTEST
jgi:hypothetical protein